MALHIHQFPCLSDNYGFLLHDDVSGLTASIDTPDGAEIAKQAKGKGWTLSHIFNTHHHFDHVGGNDMLKAEYGLTIIGPEADKARIPHIDKPVSGGGVFKFGGHDIHVLHTPGHTTGHCAYYVPDAAAIFVGDTIFALGCGRLFEGTPAQMFDSIAKICALPDDTQIYCAHEYTLSNGKFALNVDGDNADLLAYMEDAKTKRAKNLPTVPTTIAKEKLANPFVRAKSAEALGAVRAAKDGF